MTEPLQPWQWPDSQWRGIVEEYREWLPIETDATSLTLQTFRAGPGPLCSHRAVIAPSSSSRPRAG